MGKCKFCGKDETRSYWKTKACCNDCFQKNNFKRKIEERRIKDKKRKIR